MQNTRGAGFPTVEIRARGPGHRMPGSIHDVDIYIDGWKVPHLRSFELRMEMGRVTVLKIEMIPGRVEVAMDCPVGDLRGPSGKPAAVGEPDRILHIGSHGEPRWADQERQP